MQVHCWRCQFWVSQGLWGSYILITMCIYFLVLLMASRHWSYFLHLCIHLMLLASFIARKLINLYSNLPHQLFATPTCKPHPLPGLITLNLLPMGLSCLRGLEPECPTTKPRFDYSGIKYSQNSFNHIFSKIRQSRLSTSNFQNEILEQKWKSFLKYIYFLAKLETACLRNGKFTRPLGSHRHHVHNEIGSFWQN